jgi:hypothetical protein
MTDMANRMDLTGAWIERVEAMEDRLTLFVDGVRRFGFVFGGHVVFEGVTKLEGSDPRLPSGAPELSGGMYVQKQHDELGTTVLEMRYQVWPADVYEPRFAISHRSVSSDLRLRPARTVRAWVGFYPQARDRQTR